MAALTDKVFMVGDEDEGVALYCKACGNLLAYYTYGPNYRSDMWPHVRTLDSFFEAAYEHLKETRH